MPLLLENLGCWHEDTKNEDFFGLLFALILPVTSQAGWSQWGTVTLLHTNSSPARVYVEGVTINDAGCTVSGLPTVMIEGSQATDNAKELYGTLLAAFMAGKEIRLYSNVCWSAYSVPIVSAIEMR